MKLKAILFLVFLIPLLCNAQDNPHGRSLDYDCSLCHEPQSWRAVPAKLGFDHSQTGFLLSGKHTTAGCRDCHKSLVFTNVKKECFSCHIDPHRKSLGSDCQRCHTPQSWTPLNIMQMHNTFRFPLTGVHNISTCGSCHTGAENFIFSGLSASCISCHRNDYVKAKEPQHQAMGLSHECTSCHTFNSSGWKAEKFQHPVILLKGAHENLKCSQCHNAANPRVTQKCFDCHSGDYNRTREPNHLAAQFPQDCQLCHNTTTWVGAVFNHAGTSFPLTGVHSSTPCSSCHTSGYSGTPSTCISCHNNNYQSASNPDHKAIQIPSECQTCHTTQGWKPASFPIHNQYYPLLGAHSAIASNCGSCHTGSYSNTPNTCFGCHETRYNATVNPAHKTAGFPVECQSCHSQSAWTPSTFNHDGMYFPVYSGKHRGQWNSCSDCHTNSSSFKVFSCVNCHEHNKASMDSEHGDVSGYLYQSAACLNCHPNGEEGRANTRPGKMKEVR